MRAIHRHRDERGATRLSWLTSRHSFSFAHYRDPAWAGFRALRVLNDDVVAPSGGFGPHPHRNAEILSFVLDGALLHEDGGGSRCRIGPGEVQRMSAGRGVVHAEWNASQSRPVRFIQVWLLPSRPDTAPTWERAAPGWRDKPGPVLVASGDGRDGSLHVGSDANVYAARLSAGHGFAHALRAERGVWLQVLDGRVAAGALPLEAGDGLAISETDSLELRASEDAELLLFDLA